MKLKSYFFSAMMVAAFSGLGSCSSDSAEEPNVPVLEGTEEQVDYFVSLSLPDEYRTRAAAPGTVGSDGLYAFTRNINRLWYAVYVDGEFLYCSEDRDVEQAVKNDTGFGLNIKLHRDQDPTKVNVFFWAGDKDDAVTVSKTGVPSFNDPATKIDIDYYNGCVTVSPKYLNGDNASLKEFDSFAGYFQLAATVADSEKANTFTLTRPFAQIHILTDELTFPTVAAAYPYGITTRPGFGSTKINKDNALSNLKNPTTWYYKSFDVGGVSYAKNNFWYGQEDNYYEFTNMISGNSPERVTFKGRKMDYLGCYLVFAPQSKQSLKNGSEVYGFFNLGFKDVSNPDEFKEFAYVQLPSDGIKANERYVIYNHYIDPSNPGEDENDEGFLSKCFTFEVTTSPTWDGTVETEK